ncbi:uncharacterized protein [Ptychodera flava]|uniref:uncharacterized protein n=1 Tax=Ptychodera flava TaxID=63121 RepID=UPI00396AA961
MPGANTNTDTQWAQAVLRLTSRAPDVGGSRWATLTSRFLGYHHSTLARHRHFSDSSARNAHQHVETMARGQPGMTRSRTLTDLYQHQRSKPKQAAKGVKTRRTSNASVGQSQFPPINGNNSPPLTGRPLTAKPVDENLRRSREDVSFLPNALKHVGSSNSIASNGSGPVKPELLQSKRHSSPAIIPVAAERRVSFDVGVSVKSSGDGAESMASGFTKSSGPNSNSSPSKLDRLLRPISVMTNYSSPLSSVIEQTFAIEQVQPEPNLDQVRPQTVAEDTSKVSKVKNGPTKIQQHVLPESKLPRKKPANVKAIFRNNNNYNKWPSPMEHKEAKLDHNRNERRPSKGWKQPINPAKHFDSVSDYDLPSNTHRTLTFIYDEKEGKSEMVADTPRSQGFLKSAMRQQYSLADRKNDGEELDEDDSAEDEVLCAPLTEENLQSREEYDEIPDKNRQILNWVLSGYLESEGEEPQE